MTSSTPNAALLEDLVDEYLEACRRGERPSIEAFTARYPELAVDLREVLPAAELMEHLAPGTENANIPGSQGNGLEGVPEQLGEYRIVREIGRGGMGIVYEAVQETLGRQVALKVLPPQATLHPQYLERFRREAQAAARLHHSNIVPVFGVGSHSGVYFIAMQFIAGQPLDGVLKELQRCRNAPANEKVKLAATIAQESRLAQYLLTGRFQVQPLVTADALARTPSLGSQPTVSEESRPTGRLTSSSLHSKSSYFHRLAEMTAQVADALEYAHQRGVIHRDIKPSNLLLDEAGVVWVTDFGLAKATGSAELTHTGDIMGTLRYMAPEQLEGQADARSDVYSLGITLYELATLTPAFADPIRTRLLDRVKGEDPARPRRLEPDLPLDLETVILKATAKKPERRYASAAEFAADLRRFLSDRPIAARRARFWETAWRWCRRNPTVATLAGLLFVSLLLGTVLSLTFAMHAASEKQAADMARDQAERDLNHVVHAIEHFLVANGSQRLRNLPLMEPLRRQFLVNALSTYRALLAERSNHPVLKRRMGGTALLLARLQVNLSENEAATEAASIAAEITQELLLEEPENPALLAQLAEAITLRAFAHHTRQQLSDAVRDLEQAIEAATAARRLAPTDRRAFLAWSGAQLKLSRVRLSQTRHDEALTLATSIGKDLKHQVAAHPNDAALLDELLEAEQVAGFILSDLARFDAARAELELSLSRAERLVELQPAEAHYKLVRAGVQRDLAEVCDLLDDETAALRYLLAAEAETQAQARAFPSTPYIRTFLATIRLCLAKVQEETGETESAERELRLGLADVKAASESYHDPLEHPLYEAKLRLQLGNVLLKQETRRVEAVNELRQCLKLLDGLARQGPVDQRILSDLAWAYDLLSKARLDDGATREALTLAQRGQEYLTPHIRHAAPSIHCLRAYCNLFKSAHTALLREKKTEAALAVLPPLLAQLQEWLKLARERTDLSRTLVSFLCNQLGAVANNHATALLNHGDATTALEYVDKALTWQREALSLSPQDAQVLLFLRNHHGLKAHILRQLHRKAEADKVHEEFFELFSTLAADYPRSLGVRRHLGLMWLSCGIQRSNDQLPPAAAEAFRQASRWLGEASALAPGQADCRKEWLAALRHQGQALITLDRHQEVHALALQLPPREVNDGVYWAGLLGQCMNLVEADALDEEAKARLKNQYADRALLLLQESADKGYARPDLLRKSKTLEPLKGHSAFQTALSKVEANLAKQTSSPPAGMPTEPAKPPNR